MDNTAPNQMTTNPTPEGQAAEVLCIGRRGDNGCGFTGGYSGGTCPECGGMLLDRKSIAIAVTAIPSSGAECPRCEGTGKYKRFIEPEKPCALCNGTGRILTPAPRVEAAKFRITWSGSRAEYRVSIPDYDGGEVVPAEIATALETDLLAARARVRELEAQVIANDYHDVAPFDQHSNPPTWQQVAEMWKSEGSRSDRAADQFLRERDAARARVAEVEKERDGNRVVHETFRLQIQGALDMAGAETLHPDIGAEARKPMMPQERVMNLRDQLLASTTRERRLREALDEVKAITEGLRQPGWADEQSVSASRQQIAAALTPESQGEGA